MKTELFPFAFKIHFKEPVPKEYELGYTGWNGAYHHAKAQGANAEKKNISMDTWR
jgi:hypothetical protein